MDTTWIEVAGLTIRAPVTAGTNFLLAVQCVVYYRWLRSSRTPGAALWGAFFLLMAFATVAGVIKHGFRQHLTLEQFDVVLWMSNLGGGVSTYFAQRATVQVHASARWRTTLERLVALQLLLFLVAGVFAGPELMVLLVDTALGLLPVIAVEAVASRRAAGHRAWIAVGLSLSMLTAVAYVLRLSVGPWFNHIDIAHVLMGVSFYLVLKGVR